MRTRVRIGAEGVPAEKLHEIVEWLADQSRRLSRYLQIPAFDITRIFVIYDNYL